MAKNSANQLEGIAGLVRGKLYYVEAAPTFWQKEPKYVTVQLVALAKQKPDTLRDANMREWEYLVYPVEGPTSSIGRVYVKAKQLLDKEFIDGELFQCLS